MKTATRTRGRPSQTGSENLTDLVMATALELFLELGYTGTSIGKVAARSKASKHTIYRRYASKEKLFVDVVNMELLRALKPFSAAAMPKDTDPVEALRVICRTTVVGLLNPQVTRLYRVAIAEVERMPDMASLLREKSTQEFVDPLIELVKQGQQQGTIIAGDPTFIARHILMSVVGYPFVTALLGSSELLAPEAIGDHFDAAWALIEGSVRAA